MELFESSKKSADRVANRSETKNMIANGTTLSYIAYIDVPMRPEIMMVKLM